MGSDTAPESDASDDCVLPPPPMPAGELARYGIDRDPDSEQDIARYVEIEAPDEKVQHVERIKTEVVMGEDHVVWDVTTDKNRWWVITNLTNLYRKDHFPSLDFTLSFHVGLMMRMRSRPESATISDPTPFDDVFRRQGQAKDRLDRAVEAEDYQTVGMLLRECLLSLVAVLRRRVSFPDGQERPQDANFVAWITLVMDTLCPGDGNKELRQHLKNTSKDTWQLVNWLTHDRSANETAAAIAVHACDMVVGHSVQILERGQRDRTDKCPACSSRNIRTHFDMAIEPDGDYYQTCGVCGWSSHPNQE